MVHYYTTRQVITPTREKHVLRAGGDEDIRDQVGGGGGVLKEIAEKVSILGSGKSLVQRNLPEIYNYGPS